MPDRSIGADSLGQSDFDIFADTIAHTPDGFNHWIAIRPLESDITPDAIGVINGSNMDGIMLTKDVVYQGRFNNIDLAAGKIQAYRSNT